MIDLGGRIFYWSSERVKVRRIFLVFVKLHMAQFYHLTQHKQKSASFVDTNDNGRVPLM